MLNRTCPILMQLFPCGIKDKSVTSLSEEGLEISMLEVVNTVSELATEVGKWSGKTDGCVVENLTKRAKPIFKRKGSWGHTKS